MKNTAFLFFLLMIFLAACSPKTGQTTAETEKPEEQTEPQESVPENCARFQDSPRREYLLDRFVLYRDQIKGEKFEEAFSMWKEVYETAPAADGKRSTVFRDGIRIYEHFYQQETDSLKKREYVDRVMALYDHMVECYGEEDYVKGLKAFDLYYTYTGYRKPKEVYTLFTEAIEGQGEKTPVFVFNPFTALLIQLLQDEEIPMEEAQRHAERIKQLIAYNKVEKSEEEFKAEGWDIVEGYALVRLEDLEGFEDFYDCDYYMEKYYPEFEASPADCEVAKTVYGRLRWGKCDLKDERLTKVKQALVDNECIEIPKNANTTVREAYTALEEGRYKEAVTLFEQAVEETDDTDRKASFNFIISKIYYAHLKRYSTSRTYARKALKLRPKWGEPYILIGKLYASSGPLCGPGRGWDSQIVTWPAIDKWQYAKSIDPSVADEANQLINRYTQYMPSMEDIHQRTLKVGAKFRVECWIQETTTIRPGKKF
jgi:tetratricopeptide (TPR) repeat protein